MDTAAHVFLYIAAGCLVVLTAMLVAIFYLAITAALEARTFFRKVSREIERVFLLERRITRQSRLASRWLTHLPGRLFEAWGERRYY